MLNITNLSADYGGKPALEEINLTLDSGELLVVLGPSGCGKTTLLNLIAGFVPYQHGSITLEGQQGLAGIVRGEIRLPFGKAGGVESRQFVADLHQAGDLIRGQLPGPMDQ